MKLTNKGRYAVMAMADLASNAKDGPISLSEISLRQNISLAYLEQIFIKLKNNRLVKSSRGANGGYYCEIAPSEINVAEIVESIDGPIAITACLDESDDLCTTQSICLLSGNWNKANNAILEALKSVSLSDLLNPEDFLKTQNTDTSVLHT